MLRFRRVLLSIAAALAGCGMPLERYSEVEDLRVLAMRTTPPEIFVDPQDPNAERTITFEALVVDPRGEPVSFQWRFCPIEADFGCSRYEQARAEVDDPALRDSLDALYETTDSGNATPQQSELTPRQLQPYTVPSFSVTPPLPLFVYHAQTSVFGALQGAWPAAVLTLEAPNEPEPLIAQKRVVLNVRDPAAFAEPIAEEFGFDLCPTDQPPEDDEDCIRLPVREANRNPVFKRLEVAYTDAADADFEPVEQMPLEVEADAAIRLRPVFTEQSYEPYKQLQADLESRDIEITDKVEEISVSWFVSSGRVQDELTWPKFTKTLDTVYRAPEAPPAETDGRARVWLVAQDQRGGASWRRLDLQINP